MFVTQPTMPDLAAFIPYLEAIWANKILTNGGPFHKQLEEELCRYLGVKYISLFSNGTIALITALQALGITGEVITTPYSFVATSHSILWNNLRPVFVDIDPITLNLDAKLVESAITSNTTAIMPVHCYGTPCDVNQLRDIAEKYGIKLIYDAAHAFGVKMFGESILNHGDLSVLSFHATKVFNTFEGGAIVCGDAETKRKIDQLKNFGITDEITVVAAGINGKMHELSAAFGLLQLKGLDEAMVRRQEIDARYRSNLSGLKGLQCIRGSTDFTPNYSYFPILIEEEFPMGRDTLFEHLRENGIFARRYFYPLITAFSMYSSLPSAKSANLPVAARVANQVICLPMYSALSLSNVDFISDVIASV